MKIRFIPLLRFIGVTVFLLNGYEEVMSVVQEYPERRMQQIGNITVRKGWIAYLGLLMMLFLTDKSKE